MFIKTVIIKRKKNFKRRFYIRSIVIKDMKKQILNFIKYLMRYLICY